MRKYTIGILSFCLLIEIIFNSLAIKENNNFLGIATAILIIATIMSIIILAIINKFKKNNIDKNITPSLIYEPVQNEQVQYETIQSDILYHGKSFMTDFEKDFYKKLKQILKDDYEIQAQIPLSSIIKKDKEKWQYQNELFKTIDFGIFSKDMELLALIELNDKTHLQNDRIKRDLRVQEICNQAKIPLITFWTNEKLTNEYIRNKIKGVLN